MNVNYYLISAEKWETLETKDSKSFYLVGGTDLYLGTIKLSNASDVATAVSNIAKNAEDITTINEALEALKGDGDDSIANMIDAAIDEYDEEFAAVAKSGAATDVTYTDTTGKLDSTNVGAAIAEVMGKIQQSAGAGEIEVVKQESAEEGFSATYYVTQGGVQAGAKINIPKDYFAKDASVKTVAEENKPVAGYKVGQKYIDIEVNVVDNTETTKHLYILCDDVITPYTVKANATQVQLAISDSNEISATIVAGSITSDELDTTINESIAKANSALQADDITDIETRLEDIEEAVGDGGTVDEKIEDAIDEFKLQLSAEDIKVSGMSAYPSDIEDVKAALEEVAKHLTWQTISD